MEDYFENALFGTPFTAAVIVAAGSSQRMGGEDKQFIELCGKPVLARSMAAFQHCPIIEEIVVVTKPSSVEAVRKMAEKYGIDKLKAVVEGGENRAASVQNGVEAVSAAAEFVAIHDGARPLVRPDMIDEMIRLGGTTHAVAPAIPMKDTVKIADGNGLVLSTPDRSTLYAVQTPQVFQANILKAALQSALAAGAALTDDCSAVERLGKEVYLTPGWRENIKITTPEDLAVAEAFLRRRGEAQ